MNKMDLEKCESVKMVYNDVVRVFLDWSLVLAKISKKSEINRTISNPKLVVVYVVCVMLCFISVIS